MTNVEKIKAEEAKLGRALTSIEKLQMFQTIPGRDTDNTWEIIAEETIEGRGLVQEYNERLNAAKQSSGVGERHRCAHWFSAEKRKLMSQFENGAIQRVGKQQ